MSEYVSARSIPITELVSKTSGELQELIEASEYAKDQSSLSLLYPLTIHKRNIEQAAINLQLRREILGMAKITKAIAGNS